MDGSAGKRVHPAACDSALQEQARAGVCLAAAVLQRPDQPQHSAGHHDGVGSGFDWADHVTEHVVLR